MIICTRHIGLVVLWYVFSYATADAQAQFNPKAGLETWSLKDEAELFGQSKHPGQMVGFDVFVEDSRFIFVPGFYYHRISLENEEKSFSFGVDEQAYAHYFMIPVTAGYKLLDKSMLALSVVGGGEVTFFYDVDDNDLGFVEGMFYGLSTNLTAMLHAEFFSILTTEVKYHYALQPLLKNRDDSKLRGWTLAVGVKF